METIELEEGMKERGKENGENVGGMFKGLDEEVCDVEYEGESVGDMGGMREGG